MNPNCNRLSAFALCVCLSACTSSAAYSPQSTITCPAFPDNPLTGVTVYDGPLTDMAILKPDGLETHKGTRTSIWPQLGYINAQGRAVEVVCQYQSGKSQHLKSAAPLETCRFSEGATHAKTFECK